MKVQAKGLLKKENYVSVLDRNNRNSPLETDLCLLSYHIYKHAAENHSDSWKLMQRFLGSNHFKNFTQYILQMEELKLDPNLRSPNSR